MCVCESNSVPKRSKLLSWEFSWCSCRGTQEAHRAVSNEALYGVFRISGLITLTYLHLWNCWQAVLIPCFPALGPRTLSPHTIIIAFNQFLSRSFLFSLFNCFKTGVSQVFFSTLVLCLNLLLTEYKRSRCFFPSLKLHSLWQAINGHSDTLVTQKRMWKQCIPSSWLIKCVLGGAFCQSPVVIPLPGGVARYSPCGVCQEISLWNISLISFGSRIHLICTHCSWLDSWLHSDYLFGETWWCWILRLKSSIDPSLWISRCWSIFFLKIRYRSISFENLIHEYLLELMIHEYLLKLHLIHNLSWNFSIFNFPSFQEFLYISVSTFSFFC